MTTDILKLIGGVGVIFFGAEWLVRGAVRLATRLGVHPVVLGLTIGYGYRPSRAVWWIVGFILLGAVLFQNGADGTQFQEIGGDPPAFNTFVYFVDLLDAAIILDGFNEITPLYRPHANHWPTRFPWKKVFSQFSQPNTTPAQLMLLGELTQLSHAAKSWTRLFQQPVLKNSAMAHAIWNGRASRYSQRIHEIRKALGNNDEVETGFARLAPQDEVEAKQQIDDYITTAGIDAPPEEIDPIEAPNLALLSAPVQDSLDLKRAGINTVIWCTGFTADFNWIQGLELDSRGTPVHANGVSSIPGLYFNGFPWLRNRASGLIYGGVRDGKHIASLITCGSR